jgi:hypothetical protein
VSREAGLAPGGARSWRLGTRTRKGVFLIHIASAGSWLGIDVVMAVLIFTAVFTTDDRTMALSYQALGLFVVWSLLIAGLVCLASGIVLGLGTKYGLVRYWWVATKLVLNLLLTALVLIALRGEVAEKAEQGRRFLGGEQATLVDVGELLYPPIVSPTVLLVALMLAVFKPWGRIRKRPASSTS